METHSDKPLVQCLYCPARLNEVSMKSHVENIHENKSEKCTLCEFESKQKGALKMHFRKTHTDLTIETCDSCGITTKALKKHKKRVVVS